MRDDDDDHDDDSRQWDVTLVTAYYPTPTKKASQDKYLAWARNFMTLECPHMVVFVPPGPIGPALLDMRPPGLPRPKVVTVDFEALEAWQLWGDDGATWVAQHRLDPEARIHAPELYAAWAQKAFFLARVAAENPFRTPYFMWTDIGAFRGEGVPEAVRRSYPIADHFRGDKLLMLAVRPLEPGDALPRADGIRSYLIGGSQFRNGGGIFGGSAAACARWLPAYVDMVKRYVAAGRFAGKDQAVMLSTYLHDKSLAEFVRPYPIEGVDVWFFLLYLCAATGVPRILDPTYE